VGGRPTGTLDRKAGEGAMMNKRYWFPAKRYGWGWGPPVTWQGWVVTLLWFAVVIGAIPLFDTRRHPLPYLGFVLVMIVVLLVICYAKGEPPRWRWGKSRDAI
jgi:peptidoglycan/LPS O-acetylase OafA/YrhL